VATNRSGDYQFTCEEDCGLYDIDTHTHWRLVAGSDELRFEASSDGVTWGVTLGQPQPLPAEKGRVWLVAEATPEAAAVLTVDRVQYESCTDL
jgi:hypothetical protein